MHRPPPAEAVSRRWFYLRDDQAHGPFAESEIRARLRRGQLATDTRGWHEDAEGWLPLPRLLEHAAQDTAPGQGARRRWDDAAPHPVRRYLARLVDIGAFGLLAMSALFLVLYAAAPETGVRFTEALGSTGGRTVDLLLTVVLSSLLAALPLGLTGSTLGKWLFGIRVVDATGTPSAWPWP
ncbi:RDD family protein [Alkalisalibacterium limincola]|uniref:RDD family protein n=1 Tax=Alkalisalibacterium limincola TaxID=2699169 RepID=A0A5C8L0C5_9GAMM|nr:RDD family protein [Alkalisalibacterium limincola]TXK65603.1 RDD family protein [Alkalisalibacterium limincola]